ncbi:vacuole membrane protein 1-like [Teleopsis dalmanni]|uniref:vacuole membrane protein 1-like n=1 Tax=Teleopsis dalmanni TaxID=139649 RepID=UPI0018CE2DB9|nr:vacuole membrane protein 1-like [Teleopsis dalmanni]XP_037935195.1 vacuole membrane protein 1-like [Teleopsis dalmanni]XP_037935196.1 vacuole membrane protein 1-like [Teleopsis dalmanni]XP_037935355.1 vacuole membrane protein 1-like [Teleopsis dalmanni]XP_037935356.1 vacuole membrane protein 1-like [Teleopsis dalmanni]XP_037935357.1 vacuole membrane protein 1-like [Teleopsis dalmanni]
MSQSRNRRQQQHQQNAENVKQKSTSTQNERNKKTIGDGPHKNNTMSIIPNQSRKKPNTQKEKERAERELLVLWRKPIDTLKFSALELITLIKTTSQKLLQQRALVALFVVFFAVLSILYYTPGPHQVVLDIIRKNTVFFVYWIGLGVLSSVGLGTGLHTFLLYLGPHIASVTLAAYECNSLKFPSPPYPDDIICPEEPYTQKVPNLWTIMSKVRLEAFLWGAGTALGELPPYFMAKAARLSGYDPDDAEELAEFEALKAKRNQKNLGIVDRGKLFMERVVERIGFFGILACASIPNPLFDLAGITCGHFLVPFWTFFGATLIGKAIIKMHIQKIFVIIAFNETLIERAVDLMGSIPFFGKKLQEPFKGFLNNQKLRLHRQKNKPQTESGNLLSKIFECFVVIMIMYFIVSIINSLAQSYHKRIHKKPNKKTKRFVIKE